MTTFRQKLEQRIKETNSNLCIGLDPRPEFIDGNVKDFLFKVVEETEHLAACFKPNIAYYEAMGIEGLLILAEVLGHIDENVPVILDAKRSDIGETARYYARACFEFWDADAVTLNPFMGSDTIEPFLSYRDRGVYLLAVTSNDGAQEIEMRKMSDGRYVFEAVGDMAADSEHIGLVVGLTNAADEVLDRIEDVPLLVPGLGAQGGDLEKLSQKRRKAPVVVNVSRGILFSEPNVSFEKKATRYVEQIGSVL